MYPTEELASGSLSEIRRMQRSNKESTKDSSCDLERAAEFGAAEEGDLCANRAQLGKRADGGQQIEGNREQREVRQ